MKKKIKENKKNSRVFSSVLSTIIIIVSTILIMTALYMSFTFRNKGIKDIVYHLKSGIGGTSPDVVFSILGACIIPFTIMLAVLLLPMFLLKRKKNYPAKRAGRIKMVYSIGVMCIASTMFYNLLGGDDYVKAVFQESPIIEENYVDPRNVTMNFPEKKQNLILIYAESIENSVLNKNIGGGWNYSIMPELEEIALENTNFSNTDKIGGFHQVEGTTWSIAGITASTSGIPLKGFVNNEYKSENFLDGAYSLGDVLRDEGYNLKVMMGSKAEFGGKEQFFKNHGNYDIFDFHHAVDNGYMREEDKVWWGYEDSKLFEWSKEEATKLASEDKPFNLVIETVNTHYTDGWLEEGGEEKFDTQYENVHAQSSQQINEFVEWVKQQDFYENTTIVIMGDHLGMQDKFYSDNLDSNYDRTVYNAIINPRIEAKNNKNRSFTTFDMYPTILASLGVEIEGEQLGLGINMYSGKDTLVEKYGYDYFNEELMKNSTFYNDHILGEDAKDGVTLRK
ncbi:MAG: LTA synthase family protein [Miniphocaeibacter sp.]|uniref:LTA synthase family protein n=1 Tax=Miniphocaeibacter sp. TaxID=3100973 RepID=UPI00181DD612|nr:LTA synthase family protein [Gallicola sp.]